MPLTASEAKAAAPGPKDYKLSDEKGLYLLVKSNGAKYWRLKYRAEGKEKLLSLGVFPETTLAMARQSRDDARLKIRQGIDPSLQRRAAKRARIEATSNSFAAIAYEWLEKRGEKSKSADGRLKRLLENDLFPRLGQLPITAITPPTLLAELRRIESRGAIETAHRAKQNAGQIFRYAIATGRLERDPSADLSGALASPKVTHLAAFTSPKDAGRLMQAIDQFKGTQVVRAALKLSALFFCRPGELRQLEWSEVNWDEQRIEIPAKKMKTREPHIIPLCRQALIILEELHIYHRRGPYIFPSARGASRPLSENGVRTALRTMGFGNEEHSPHGFRAMARTLLDEVLGYRIEWIEQQLGHAVKDVHGRAYNRTKHLEQRREMMQRWADYLDELTAHAVLRDVRTIGCAGDSTQGAGATAYD